jgi:CrcB protein
MYRAFLLVGIGGFIGSVARIISQQLAQRYFPLDFPVGTLVVNVFGSFVIGLVYGLSEHHNFFSAETKLFLTAGLCGGFTTFSSFSYEALNLMRTGEYFSAALYVLIGIVTGLLFVFLGFYLGKSVA